MHDNVDISKELQETKQVSRGSCPRLLAVFVDCSVDELLFVSVSCSTQCF